MIAIMKRDLRGFFSSAIGYVFLAVFLLINNYYFYSICIQRLYSSISYVFAELTFVLVFTIPIVTMRLMSEERRQKTDQLLLTAPVRVVDIVMGKFLAAFVMFFIAFACTLTWPIIITMFGTPTSAEIIGNYTAMLFAVACLVSIGIFISSLTESQVIAAVLSFILIIGMYYFSSIASAIDNPFVSSVLNWLSIFSRYKNFTSGVFALDDIFYYISVTAVFLFLTTRVIEKRRWS